METFTYAPAAARLLVDDKADTDALVSALEASGISFSILPIEGQLIPEMRIDDVFLEGEDQILGYLRRAGRDDS